MNEKKSLDLQNIPPIEALESAMDYEHGIAHLGDSMKAIVWKLRELAGDLAKVAGN